MANEKVFGSDITRTLNNFNNDLYDLLKIDPVIPLPVNDTKHLSCGFVPKTDKYYIPQKKLRPKVKTVRDIRHLFEKDVYTILPMEIEKQQNLLLRKIRGGSSKDEKTKLLARNLIKNEKPISRTAWQMVININPDNCAHSSQYVLWNGKRIQVNGSRGGKYKFIYKYDLGEGRASLLNRYNLKKSKVMVKKNLLKHSLNIKFKPGPLSKKKQLDMSYQKYNIGNIELAYLPKPGLDILPEYGKPLETSVANFLHNLRDDSGVISEKWAEFAVSALGTYDNGRAVQLDKESCVTFNLSYKYDQRGLLMRCDVDKLSNRPIEIQSSGDLYTETEEITKQEVQQMLNEMLISVDISLMENKMYTEEELREFDKRDINNHLDNQPKEKFKRRGHNELHRLDVTVIRLCDSEEQKGIGECRKSFCTLGCICDSLLSSFQLKNHCGRIECMFECKCNFNKYNLRSCFEDDIISGLVSLDKDKISMLSKEEQKFHQTVILSGEKSILLKSQRRNWKAPEKYADFYSNMCLKTKKNMKRILSVVEVKLNYGNIEPWCMIHNLYKCFCKGKFTEKLPTNDEIKSIENENNNTKSASLENLEVDQNVKNSESSKKSILRPRICSAVIKENQTGIKSCTEKNDVSVENCSNQECARVKAYKKRKYSDTFYSNTNKKIMELERDDHGLRKRMLEILKIDDNNMKKPKNDSGNLSVIDLSSSPVPGQVNEVLDETKYESQSKSPISNTSSTSRKLSGDVITTQFTSPTERHLNMKLKAWLEPSLKMYRQRFGKGFFKKSLDPPKAGKIALYPWDFIISRYHENKNLFLVTNQKPFRIFMAVDNRNAMFSNCININSIDNLENYPVSVKNIITKEVDNLTDQLCILRGLSFCWELVGSVKKVCDRKSSENENNESSSDVDARSPTLPNSNTISPATTVNDTSLSISPENNTEQSKWFVMTIENDFSEIQFYNRGFFVKYDSIIKAINVARASDKTVRLSSQKCNEGGSDPQFGIYAIPTANEYCVFIGPYERNERLGIETVKNTLQNRKTKTRGVWITTNKIDNFRVIDNPLSFMSQVNLKNGHILEDSSQDEQFIESVSSINNKTAYKAKKTDKVVKLVKPIKITKTNNFYHLTSSGFLKPISTSPEKQISQSPFIIKNCLPFDLETSTANSPLMCRTLLPQLKEKDKDSHIEERSKVFSKKPIAEIAPQVKVIEECQESNIVQQITPARKFEGGMFVLKPEEINSRSLINKICFTPTTIESTVSSGYDNEIDMDIENFLANAVECSAPTNDVYVISDDEDYCNTETLNKNDSKNVWIICKSVKKIGWIAGRKDVNEYISFEFPGFKYTGFYPEEEAFTKITQVLARKIYIPEHVDLKWSVIETEEELQKLNINKLKQEDLNPDCVLTKKGLIHKSHLAEHSNKKIKTYSKKSTRKCSKNSSHDIKEENTELNRTKSNITELEAESNLLHKEGELLLSETMSKKEEISDSFSKMSNDRRQKISDRLRSIISGSNCS